MRGGGWGGVKKERAVRGSSVRGSIYCSAAAGVYAINISMCLKTANKKENRVLFLTFSYYYHQKTCTQFTADDQCRT